MKWNILATVVAVDCIVVAMGIILLLWSVAVVPSDAAAAVVGDRVSTSDDAVEWWLQQQSSDAAGGEQQQQQEQEPLSFMQASFASWRFGGGSDDDDNATTTTNKNAWKYLMDPGALTTLVDNAVNAAYFDFGSDAAIEQEEQRFLQTGDISPGFVCNNMQANSNGSLTCGNCTRFGKRGFNINCNFATPLCNSDNSTCWQMQLQQQTDENVSSLATTLCSIMTVQEPSAAANTGLVADEGEAEAEAEEEEQDEEDGPKVLSSTCIRVFPAEPGNFTYVESCSALVNGEEVCKECSLCGTINGTAAIRVDCRNTQVRELQSCGVVTPGGAAIPQWDSVFGAGDADDGSSGSSAAASTRLNSFMEHVTMLFVSSGGAAAASLWLWL